MTIPDEAVQAAENELRRIICEWDSRRQFLNVSPTPKNEFMRKQAECLTAALPFLQGVKKEPVAWSIIFSDHYGVNCETTFKTKQATENYVSSCGRGRVTPLYPAPSPRAQALEELLSDDMLKDISTEFVSWKGENPYKVNRGGNEAWEIEKPAIKAALSFAVRALSSQPVADGWLPIETAPTDETLFLAYCPADEDFPDGRMMIWKGSIFAFQKNPTPRHLQFPATHWCPLPASPGASECPTCHGTGMEGKNSICRDCEETRPTGGSDHGE